MPANMKDMPSRLDGDDLPVRGDNFTVPTARGVLTAAEIEMLLRPDDLERSAPAPSAVSDKPIEPFDAGSADGEDLADAKALTARLTLGLRTACQIDGFFEASGVATGPFDRLAMGIAPAPVTVLFQDSDGNLVAGLALAEGLAKALIDVACGGIPVSTARPERPRSFSSLDRLLIERVLQPLAAFVDPAYSIACIETDLIAAQAMMPPNATKIAELQADVNGVGGKAAFARIDSDTAEVPAPAEKKEQTIAAILTARIASLQVPVSRLANLKAGSTLLLGLPTDQPVELLSGGRSGPLAATGDVGRQGNKIAVRLTKIAASLRR
ncbi:MAG: FliM/FliN family flagellar motor switch protein [Pseudomonadota bacterium]